MDHWRQNDTYSTANTAGKITVKSYYGGRQVLGKTPKLGEFVYKSHTKDQADMYIRTTDAIADHVGMEYSRDMRMLVKKGTEKTFTKPTPPKSKESSVGELQEYKMDLSIYHKAKKEYANHKSKVFL